MTVWTPGDEAYAPFDEEGEVRDDIPQDLLEFIQRFDIQKQFTVEIKKWNNEGYQGRPSTVGRLEAVVPTYESVVAMNGPGHYGFDTSWTPKGGKARNAVFKVSLVGPHWVQLHKDAKVKKHEEELEEAKKQAELERARGAGGAAPLIGSFGNPNQAGREYMQGILGDIKGLTEAFGINVQGGKGNAQDNSMPMMFLGMMQMMMKAQENSTNLLITVLSNQNKGGDTREMLGLFKDMLTIKDGMLPKDKSWIEEVVGAVADNFGSIVGMFAKGNPEEDPLYQKFDAGLASTRDRVKGGDTEFLRNMVKHMDSKVGASMTDKILKGFLNVNRTGAPANAQETGQGGTNAAGGPQGDGGGSDASEGEE